MQTMEYGTSLMSQQQKMEELESLKSVDSASNRLNRFAIEQDDIIYLPEDDAEVDLYKIMKITKDLKSNLTVIKSMSRQEIKMLVTLFYQLQELRKATKNQLRAIEDDEKKKGNTQVLTWILQNFAVSEIGIRDCLHLIAENSEVGQWLTQIIGIGDVLAAGLIAHFDVTGKKYATQFISYAGLNDNNRPWIGEEKANQIIEEVLTNENGKPKKTITDDDVVQIAIKSQWKYEYLVEKAFDQEKQKWDKQKLKKAIKKIPYNKNLKTLMYKVGSSFHWNCNKPNSLYGKLLSERRVYEEKLNAEGAYAEQAEAGAKRVKKDTVAYKYYKEGVLPPGHIIMRAMRYSEKIFISHLFEEMYRVKYIAPEVPFTEV